MKTTRVGREEFHGGVTGVLRGIHEGAGHLTPEQIEEFEGKFSRPKSAGVPAIVERRSEIKIAPRLISGFFFRVPKDFDQDLSVRHLVPDGYEPTVRLKRGRVIRVEWHQADGHTQQECLSFIKDKDGLLVGPQGLFLLWHKKKNKFPKNLWVLSLDREELLLRKHGGNPCLPGIFTSTTVGNEIYLVETNDVLNDKICFPVITYAQ